MAEGFWGNVVMAPAPLTELFIACSDCWRGNHDECPDLFYHPIYEGVSCHCDHKPGSGPLRSTPVPAPVRCRPVPALTR